MQSILKRGTDILLGWLGVSSDSGGWDRWVAFLLVILFSFLGGMRRSEKDIEPTKYNIYCILTDLTMLSLIALVYTNDLFTAYVFIEINTIASCAIVMAKDTGHTNMATIRYIIMSQLGSGLFLLAAGFVLDRKNRRMN